MAKRALIVALVETIEKKDSSMQTHLMAIKRIISINNPNSSVSVRTPRQFNVFSEASDRRWVIYTSRLEN